MSKDTLYDFNIDSPATITDELYSNVGSTAFQLGTVKRAFKGLTDVVIRTAASGGGDLLIEGVDYNIVNEDFKYTEETGYHVYTGIQVLTVGYQTGNLYISYACVGSYTAVASIQSMLDSFLLNYNVVGTIRKSASYNPESNELLCDGSAISRSTYATLYAKITTNKGAFTVTIATPGVFTLTAHGLLDGHCIELTTTGALPTGLTANTNYYVEKIDANTFYLHAALSTALAHTSGSRIATSGTQSGTHSLRFCPWGISGASNFLIPNHQAVVAKGAGSQTINANSKTAPPFGGSEEDQTELHKHETALLPGGAGAVYGTGGAQTVAYMGTLLGGNVALTNTPYSGRVGTTTRENSVSFNFFIKFE
jgi:hypothetical protein